MTKPVYVVEDFQFAKLRMVEKRLYGDGSRLTEDARRDLANLLNLILSEIAEQHFTVAIVPKEPI